MKDMEDVLWPEKSVMVEIVSRDMWRARQPTVMTMLKAPATNVFYTLTYTGTCDNLHSFMIGSDGRVYEGRGWGVVPRLKKPYTRLATMSILIVFIAPEDDERGPEMHNAKFDLVDYGMANGYINPDFMIYDIRRDSY